MIDAQITKTTNLVLNRLKDRHSYIEIDENEFVELLRHSLSLDLSHKKKVVEAFFRLSQKQFDDLNETFQNEREQFREVSDKYPDKIVDLVGKRKEEWIALGDILESENTEESVKWEEQSRIDDIKANLGL